jgi:thiamine biosynthesis lipoprotein
MPHFARLFLTQEAVSTSGKYEQFVAANGKTYGHIIDPRTGRPADGLISVTVVSRSGMKCDAWDTPLFVLGPEAAKRKAKERTDIAAVLVEPGSNGVDTVWVEQTLKDRFVLEEQARPIFVVKYF